MARTKDDPITFESRTDWLRVKAVSQIEAGRLANEEDGLLPKNWEQTVVMGLPPGKKPIKLRVDSDVLGWFKETGKGYQTRMNNVLRAFEASRLKAEHRRTGQQ